MSKVVIQHEGFDSARLEIHSVKLSFYDIQDEIKHNLIDISQEHIDHVLSFLDSNKLQELLKQKEIQFINEKQQLMSAKNSLMEQTVIYLRSLEIQILTSLLKLEEEFYRKHRKIINEIYTIQDAFNNIRITNIRDLAEHHAQNVLKFQNQQGMDTFIDWMNSQMNQVIEKSKSIKTLIDTHNLLFQAKFPNKWLITKIRSLPKQVPSALEYMQFNHIYLEQFENVKQDLKNIEKIKKLQSFNFSEIPQISQFIGKLKQDFDQKSQFYLELNSHFINTPKQMYAHKQRVNKITISPDSTLIASTAKDNTIRLWDSKSFKQIRVLNDVEANNIIISKNQKYLAVNVRQEIWVWYFENLKQLPIIIDYHSKPINHLAFFSTNNYVASCSHDHTLRVWDLNGNKQKSSFLFPQIITHFSISSDSNYIISIDQTGKLYRLHWNELQQSILKDYKRLFDIWQGHNGGSCVEYCSDGSLIVSSGYFDKIVKLWNNDNLQLIKCYKTTNRIMSVQFSQDSRWVIQQNETGTIRIWDISNGQLIWSSNVGKNNCNVILCPENNFVVCSGEENELKVWKREN